MVQVQGHSACPPLRVMTEVDLDDTGQATSGPFGVLTLVLVSSDAVQSLS